MKQATAPEPIKVLPFRSKEGRLFVEIDPRIERAGRILAGEPLTLELIEHDIVFHRDASTGQGQSESIER